MTLAARMTLPCRPAANELHLAIWPSLSLCVCVCVSLMVELGDVLQVHGMQLDLGKMAKRLWGDVYHCSGSRAISVHS